MFAIWVLGHNQVSLNPILVHNVYGKKCVHLKSYFEFDSRK